MLKPLIWKEYHEQRWKLAFGTVMLAFFTGALLAARLTTDRELPIVIWLLGGLVLSLYSAMGVFAPEQTNETKPFLASKPIEPWKVFACKFLFGWLNFAVPMLLCSAALAVIALFNPDAALYQLKYIAKGTLAGLAIGTMFYSMTCCFAPRKSGEALVGLTGCIIFLIFFLHAMTGAFTFLRRGSLNDLNIAVELFVFINPLYWIGLLTQLDFAPQRSLFTLEQACLFLVTILIGLRKWKRS